MATIESSHHHLLMECPNCGARAHDPAEVECRFCQTAFARPVPASPYLPPTAPPAPPSPSPFMSASPLSAQPSYYQVTSSRSSAIGWIYAVITLLVFLVPAIIIASVNASSHRSSLPSPSSVPGPTSPALPGQTPDPTIPTVPTTLVHGDATTKTIDCSAGQSYKIDGNVETVTATGGVCGTVIVGGAAVTFTADGVRDLWVVGDADQVTVPQVGNLTALGNLNTVTYTKGIDGAEPTIVKGGVYPHVNKVA